MTTRYTIVCHDKPGSKPRYRHALKLLGAEGVKISEAQVEASAPKPKPDNLPTSPEAKAVASLFGRPLDKPWMDEEIKVFKAAVKTGLVTVEALNVIAGHYKASKGREGAYLRTSILTFCRHFGTELDKARAGKVTSKKGEWLDSTPKIDQMPSPEEIERIARQAREGLAKFRNAL